MFTDFFQVQMIKAPLPLHACVNTNITFTTSVRLTNVGPTVPPCLKCQQFVVQSYLSDNAILDGSDQLIDQDIDLSIGKLSITQLILIML